MAGPLLLLGLPFLTAGLAYLVRRWSFLASFLSTLTVGALAIICMRLPLDRSAFFLGQEVALGRPIVILGQTLILDPAGQLWLSFVFLLATLLYLFSWRISQGRSFLPFSLIMLSLYALVVLLQTFSLAVLAFAISASLAVFIIQAGQRGSTRGAQRYLVVTLLAVPLLLGASWLVGQSQLGSETAVLLRNSLLPAALGFALLLAVFPFASWMPAVAADAPPMVSTFVFVAGQGMVLFLATAFLQESRLTLGDPAILAGIQLAGLVIALVGGVMAAVQRDFGRMFGYAAMSDLGYLLLAVGLGGSRGSTLGLMHMVSRAVSITLLAAGLSILRHWATTDQFGGLQGVARKLPVATMAVVWGGMALAGFPFTAGFPVHWAVRRAAWNWVLPYSPLSSEASLAVEAGQGQEWVWVLILLALLASSIGIVIGFLRGLSAMLGSGPRDDIARQPILASLMVVALAVLAILLGLYPQLFLEPVSRAAQALSLF